MKPSARIAMTAIERLAAASCQAAAGTAWHPRAAWHVLDWLGCAAHGATSAQGQAFARWLALQAEGPHPTLAGRHADAAAAAAYHGALGSALEMDDVHRSAILHPGPVVIPAALAACGPHSTGAQLLGGVLAGYEAMVRMGRALGPSHYRLWHTTSTAGCFGAAAAAAAVLGLDEQHTAQALALAGTRAGGLWQVRHEVSLGKAWHMAGAARDGLAAAQLARAGLTGPLGVLEGPSGWLAATAPEGDAGLIDVGLDGAARVGSPDGAVVTSGRPWLADVSFKPWPACRHAHPAMDALRSAAQGRELTPNIIDHIEVQTYADALRFCDSPHPTDPAQARFSIQHALAAWVTWGAPQLAHYAPEALGDAVVGALRDRVSLHEDAAIQARYPDHYGARVIIHWRDGSSAEANVTDTLGDPARPMSDQALRDKARMLMREAGWAEDRIQAAQSACLALPGAVDLDALHQVFQA